MGSPQTRDPYTVPAATDGPKGLSAPPGSLMLGGLPHLTQRSSSPSLNTWLMYPFMIDFQAKNPYGAWNCVGE